MAKRHHSGPELLGQIRRCQELILARSGVDDFYEAIRLLLAKSINEREGSHKQLTFSTAQAILREHSDIVERFLDDGSNFGSPPEVIDECFAVLNSTNLSTAAYEALDAAFEAMTSRESKSDKGQFFTPRFVIDFCIEVLRPKANELVCDPACGSAGFLKSAFDFVKKPKPNHFFGFDISRRAAKTSDLMSFLACGDVLTTAQLDSLSVRSSLFATTQGDDLLEYMKQKLPRFEGFDVIATNPPFAGDVSSSGYADQYQLGRATGVRIERDVIFIERCVGLLKPGGRLAIVLPDNKVSSQKFAEVRKWFASHMDVVSVVSLHGYTFRPYTSQKAVVLFGQKPEVGKIPSRSAILYQSMKPGKSSSGDFVFKDGLIDHDLLAIQNDLKRAWKI